MKHLLRLRIVSFFTFISSLNLVAQPAGYGFGKQVLINSAEVSGTTSLTDFPIMFSVTDSDLRTTANGGKVENANGFDITFTLGDCTTPLDHEIEKYNAVTGEYIAWIKIPSLSPLTDQGIHMYYGNSSITTDPSTTSVWSNGFVSVWHMNNDPSLAAPQIDESTSNNFDGTSVGGMTTSDVVSSQIGEGLDMDGSNDAITRTDNSSLDIGTDDLTLSAWIRLDNVTPGDRKEVINKKNGGPAENGYAYRVYGSNIEVAHKAAGQANINTSSAAPVSIAVSTWTYTAVTFNVSGDLATIYVDGAAEPSISINAGTSLANSVDLQIGKRQSGNYMNGSIDEVRIANVLRTNDWLLTEYNNQNSPGTFYTISAESNAGELCSLLPIELIDFGLIENDNCTVEINWQTKSERNNDYFKLQRSKNGVDWSVIATIEGAGNSQETISYQYVDTLSNNKISYYRLVQVDFDGELQIFNAKSFYNSKCHDLIYPNPTTGNIFAGQLTTGSRINLYNILGDDLSNKIVIDYSRNLIDLTSVSDGHYLLSIDGEMFQIIKIQ